MITHYRYLLFFLIISIFHTQPSYSVDPHRILYLMQSGHICSALDMYQMHKEEVGEHDHELIEQMGLLLLDQGYQSCDPEKILMTLYGAGIALNEKALYILEDGARSCQPEFQLVALNFLSRFQNSETDEAINRAMSSNFLPIRLEAAFLLAEMKHPKASGQIEALMQKIPPEILPLFPQLLAMAGDTNSIKTLQKLLAHFDDPVRIEAILAVAKFGRDDLLPAIRRLSMHLNVAQQEACAYALGVLRDEHSVERLTVLSHSSKKSVKLAALQALYRLGRHETKNDIECLARGGDLFAIAALGEILGSEEILFHLTKSKNIHVRLNASLALLELSDPRCLETLTEILIKDSRDLAFSKIFSYGKGLSAWKVIPSAMQNLHDTPLALEMSLHMREAAIEKALELPEKAFLQLAHLIFEVRQNDLVPLLTHLLVDLDTPMATGLLKHHREQVGAPLVRNYCNLALYRLKEPGPYGDKLQEWVEKHQCRCLIQFRPLVPWEMRYSESSKYQLTPQEASRLLVEVLESLVQSQDDLAIDLLLQAIRCGHRKNRFALAGLLIRAIN